MNQAKTNQMRSLLTGLLPETTTVSPMNVNATQPRGVELAKLYVRSTFPKLLTIKVDNDAKRMYVYFNTALESTTAFNMLQKLELNVRNLRNSVVFDDVDLFTTPSQLFPEGIQFIGLPLESALTMDVFNSKVREMCNDLANRTSTTVSYKRVDNRVYVYFISSSNKRSAFESIVDHLRIILGNEAVNVSNVGNYGANLRLDFIATPTQTPPVQSTNKLLSGLVNDDILEHVEKLRGRVSDEVLDQMKTAIRNSIPVPTWKIDGVEAELFLSNETKLDIQIIYDLLTCSPTQIQHFKDVTIGNKSGFTVTMFKNCEVKESIYVVIRHSTGSHTNTTITLS